MCARHIVALFWSNALLFLLQNRKNTPCRLRVLSVVKTVISSCLSYIKYLQAKFISLPLLLPCHYIFLTMYNNDSFVPVTPYLSYCRVLWQKGRWAESDSPWG